MTTRQAVDLNGDVLATRRLRAAAVLPQLLALCCMVTAGLFFALEEEGWKVTLILLVVTGSLLLIARQIEQGARWALLLVTALVLVMTAMGVIAIAVEPTSRVERAQGAAGAALMLVPCWILLRLGWKGIGHAARVRAVHPIAASSAPIAASSAGRMPRERHSGRALRLFVIASALYVAGVIPAGVAAAAVGGHLWIVGLVYAPIAAIAGRIWVRGRRESALGLQAIRALDTRAPLLLLRSFGDDNLPLEKRYHLFWFLFSAREALTLESFVVDRLWRLGPVLAIGKPGERLSPLGAAREYIPEDRWRDRVHEYLRECRRVVCILGGTPALRWEYAQVQALGKDEGLVIVFPPKAPEELQRRWVTFQGAFTRARAVDLQWEPFLGAPLLAVFGSNAAAVFYCRYQHETAYAAAFNRLFGMLECGSRASRAATASGKT